jgi:hypothetical protein
VHAAPPGTAIWSRWVVLDVNGTRVVLDAWSWTDNRATAQPPDMVVALGRVLDSIAFK